MNIRAPAKRETSVAIDRDRVARIEDRVEALGLPPNPCSSHLPARVRLFADFLVSCFREQGFTLRAGSPGYAPQSATAPSR